MNSNPQDVPLMLFDGDCNFCRRWIRNWNHITREHIRYAPYQQCIAQYPQVTPQQCAVAVQLLMPDGTVYAGAHAVFKALDHSGRYRWLLHHYERLPWFSSVAEWTYRFVAHNRIFFSKFS